MCGNQFEAAEAQSACSGCPLVPGCHLLRCPRCGYEMPPESKLVKWLRERRQRITNKRMSADQRVNGALKQGASK
jgi:hypothetical protein